MVMHTYYYLPSDEKPPVKVHGCELIYQKVMGGSRDDEKDDVAVWSGRCGLLSYYIQCANGRYKASIGIRDGYLASSDIAEFQYHTDEGESIDSAEQAAKVLERESRWLLLALDGWLQSSEAQRIMGTI